MHDHRLARLLLVVSLIDVFGTDFADIESLDGLVAGSTLATIFRFSVIWYHVYVLLRAILDLGKLVGDFGLFEIECRLLYVFDKLLLAEWLSFPRPREASLGGMLVASFL